jgi:poly(A) polymerase
LDPRIYLPDEHGIAAAQIDYRALKVLNHLDENGYRACLVGGGVRDLLLGREPKDFDVATDALPEDVRRLFRNARLIGRRFRLAHVRYGREVIEVATFRAPHHEAQNDGQAVMEDNGRILRDNVYGTLEQDVWRRDFTINALYYDIADGSVIDFTGGMDDLKAGVLKLIGDPEQRYREDPVRMLRAVRFAAKLGFRIDAESEAVIHNLHGLLREVSPARLFDEFLKLMHGGVALETFERLRHYGLFQHLFPATERALSEPDGEWLGSFIAKALDNTDKRISQGKTVNPAFLIAVLLWGDVKKGMDKRLAEGQPMVPSLLQAGRVSLSEQVKYLSIPRRFSMVARDIWDMQPRLHRTSGKRPLALLEHQRFRAAYDFMCLRGHAGEDKLVELCDWWTHFQASNEDERRALQPNKSGSRRRRHRPRKRKPKSTTKE